MELVYMAVVTTVGGIIMMLLYQRGNISSWAMKMDYKQGEYKHKENLAKIKGTEKRDLELLKKSSGTGIDLDKIGDLIESGKDLLEGSEDSDNPLVRLLGSKFIQGVVSKLGMGKSKESEESDEYEE